MKTMKSAVFHLYQKQNSYIDVFLFFNNRFLKPKHYGGNQCLLVQKANSQ